MLKPESNRHSEDKKGALAKESELKDKIKQKQEAFAELKKEALKVLTDFWILLFSESQSVDCFSDYFWG